MAVPRYPHDLSSVATTGRTWTEVLLTDAGQRLIFSRYVPGLSTRLPQIRDDYGPGSPFLEPQCGAGSLSFKNRT